MTGPLLAYTAGTLTLGIYAGLTTYHLALPWILSRRHLNDLLAILQRTEAFVLARRQHRPWWRVLVGEQHGRHLL
jgi:hypothetical protein